MEAYQAIRKNLHKILISVLEKYPYINTIVIVGHSLGGALATIAAIDLRNLLMHKNIITESHTFGAPHVGNKAFSNLLGIQYLLMQYCREDQISAAQRLNLPINLTYFE